MSGDRSEHKIGFFIVGGQKCGTTLALDLLRAHPHLFMPDRETTLFDREQPDLQSAIDQFFLGVPAENQEHLIGIKRPTYLTDPTVAERIQKHNPDAKIIALIRNPWERARAAYFHMMARAQLPLLDFETGMTAIMDGGFGEKVPFSQNVLTMSFQARGLQRYVELFSPERVHAALFDDLKLGLNHVFQPIHSFLGVTVMDVSSFSDHKPQEVIYSIDRLKWLNQVAELRYALNDVGIATGPKTDQTPEDLNKIQMVEMTDYVRMEPKYGNAKPTPSPELWHRMYDLYKDDITLTEHLLKRDLSHWRKPPR